MLPNKSAYRISLKEHEKLKRQVDELLERGIIYESESLYVVLALLIPKKDDLGECMWIVGLLTRSL